MDPAQALDADWVDKHRQDGLIATSVVFTVMAAIFVILRCLSRFVLMRNQGIDDYLIIGAMVLTIAYLIDIFVARNNHVGFLMTMLTPENMVSILKATLAIQVTYYTTLCCIKTSILFTYLRFAISHTFRLLCFATIILHTVFFLICFIVTLAQCRPLSKMWDLTKTAEGHCINTTAFFYSTSTFNIITDIWILGLPIKTLRAINRPNREKVALFVIFGVGTFAAIASVVRLYTIYTYTEAADPFRDALLVNLWSMIEVNVAILCASVPALKPLFSGTQRRRTREARTQTSPSGGSGDSISRPQNGSRWYTKFGSRDSESKTEKPLSSSDDRTNASVETARGTPAPTCPFPPPPALSSSKVVNGIDDASSSESILAFTPMSPPPRGHQMSTGAREVLLTDEGMNSSGPVLVLQK